MAIATAHQMVITTSPWTRASPLHWHSAIIAIIINYATVGGYNEWSPHRAVCLADAALFCTPYLPRQQVLHSFTHVEHRRAETLRMFISHRVRVADRHKVDFNIIYYVYLLKHCNLTLTRPAAPAPKTCHSRNSPSSRHPAASLFHPTRDLDVSQQHCCKTQY